jgi:hypothetical protein
MEQDFELRTRSWGAHRSATFVALMLVVLGLAAYFIVFLESLSGGYGPRVAFPVLKDQNTLRMTLTRTSCFGSCPDYSVEVRGDGRIIYEGNRCVAVNGHHDGWIPASRVEELFEEFRRADFFSLRSGYFELSTDLPTYVITLKYDRVSKTVTDYGGRRAGMPEAVTHLENAIDEIAQTDAWVRGETECSFRR